MTTMPEQKNNWWKVSFLIVVPILTGCLFYTAFSVIDSGVTLTYLEVSHEDTVQAYKALAEVFPKNYTKKDLIFLLRKSNPNMLIAEEKMSVRSDAGIFYFNQIGNLEKISLGESSD